MINVHNVQTKKEIRKHGNMLSIFIHHLQSIELRQNKRDKFVGKSTWHTFREHVRVFEIVATAKIPILGKFINRLKKLVILHSPIITI